MTTDVELPNTGEDISLSKMTDTTISGKSSWGGDRRDGYIPASSRVLSDETKDLVKEVRQKLSPVEFEFNKVVSVMVEEKGLSVSREFIDQVTELAVEYFHNFLTALLEVSQSQRRRSPSLNDLNIIFRLKNIHPSDLYKELQTCNTNVSRGTRAKLHNIEQETSNILNQIQSEDSNLDEGDPSLPFFTNEHYEIAEFLPRSNQKPQYIPSYLPDFPPEYTYQNTYDYTNRLSDLKELRLKLVEESRLTQKSLYGLVNDEEDEWKRSLEVPVEDVSVEDVKVDTELQTKEEGDLTVDKQTNEVEEEDKKVQEVAPIEVKENGETSEVSESKSEIVPKPDKEPAFIFDFEAYAKKRSLIVKKRTEEIENKCKLREKNIFMKAEKYYSPYATLKPTPEVNSFFSTALQESFNTVIKEVRLAESFKRLKLEQMAKERATREKELEDERANEQLTFEFNAIDNSSDDEDSYDRFGIGLQDKNNHDPEKTNTPTNEVDDMAVEKQIDPAVEVVDFSKENDDSDVSDDFLEAELQDAMQDDEVQTTENANEINNGSGAGDNESDPESDIQFDDI